MRYITNLNDTNGYLQQRFIVIFCKRVYIVTIQVNLIAYVIQKLSILVYKEIYKKESEN